MAPRTKPRKNPGASLGFSTRTDVGGETGTQADANPRDAGSAGPIPVAPATEQTPEPSATQETQTKETPGVPLGANAPKLDALQHQSCPNCATGVLYVTRYDPEALHEQDQGAALAKGHESGGAYDVECRQCGFTDSRALNPGDRWGR